MAQRRDAAAKPKPSAIVIREFRFVGFDKDVVGRWRDTKPDGEPDGHFRVVLVRPKSAQPNGHFVISRCSSKPTDLPFSIAYQTDNLGCEGSRMLASTKSTFGVRFPIEPAGLAVFMGGKRLTVPQRGGVRVPPSSDGVRFDLYVNGGPGCPTRTGHQGAPECRAAFAPSYRFLFMVMTDTPAGSAWISRPGDKVPQVTSPQAELRGLRFVGFDKDVVSLYPGGPLDGRPDAHWILEVATPAGPRQVTNITLERVRGAGDRADRPGAWCAPGCFNNPPNSPGPGFALLYVSLNGERVLVVPPGSTTVELPYTTAGVRLDLYANDVEPSVFTPGQRFRVTARIAPEAGWDPKLGAATEALAKYNRSTPWLTLR